MLRSSGDSAVLMVLGECGLLCCLMFEMRANMSSVTACFKICGSGGNWHCQNHIKWRNAAILFELLLGLLYSPFSKFAN